MVAMRKGRIGIAAAAGVVGVLLGAGGMRLIDSGPSEPEPCGGIFAYSLGDALDDSDLIETAWSAVTDPSDSESNGNLDGSRPVAQRTCVLFAGSLEERPTVVFLENTVSGHLNVVRIVEARVEQSGSVSYGTDWHPVLLGSEAAFGVFLPLSGAYVAPRNSGDVRVVTVGAPMRDAPLIVDGVHDTGVVADRTEAPNSRVADRAAVLVVDRTDDGLLPARSEVYLVPALRRDTGARPVHRPFRVWDDDSGDPVDADDESLLAALAQVAPQLSADPLFAVAVFDTAPAAPGLSVAFADGEMTVKPVRAGEVPVLRYPVTQPS